MGIFRIHRVDASHWVGNRRTEDEVMQLAGHREEVCPDVRQP